MCKLPISLRTATGEEGDVKRQPKQGDKQSAIDRQIQGNVFPLRSGKATVIKGFILPLFPHEKRSNTCLVSSGLFTNSLSWFNSRITTLCLDLIYYTLQNEVIYCIRHMINYFQTLVVLDFPPGAV